MSIKFGPFTTGPSGSHSKASDGKVFASRGIFVLHLTAISGDAGDTLDVFVEALIGAVWVPVIHFTQVQGSDTVPEQHVANIAGGDPGMFALLTPLAAGAVRNLQGEQYRIRYDVTDSGGNDDANFVFAVYAEGFDGRDGK